MKIANEAKFTCYKNTEINTKTIFINYDIIFANNKVLYKFLKVIPNVLNSSELDIIGTKDVYTSDLIFSDFETYDKTIKEQILNTKLPTNIINNSIDKEAHRIFTEIKDYFLKLEIDKAANEFNINFETTTIAQIPVLYT